MPVPDLATLDPSKVTATLDGTIVTGFADGSYIEARRTSDNYDLITGAHGHSLRAKRMGKVAEITFRLLPTSPTISKLRQLSDREATFEVAVVDNNPNVEKGFVAEQTWIKRDAAFLRATEAGGNTVDVVLETHFITFKG